MGFNRGVYNIVFLLHILSVIAGFGPALLAPAYAAQVRMRRGREGVAIADATYAVVSTYATWIVYSVPVFGILLVLLSDDTYKFSQAWISLSFLLYIAWVGVLHAVYQPNQRRMNLLLAELADAPAGAGPSGRPPQVAELEARGQRAALIGGLLNVLLVLILILMIWKPGGPVLSLG